ncbi:unnamed protein product, partial [Hapterophycus canaliculatus]
IRLRQAVDRPYRVIYSATKREGMTPAMNSAAGQNPAPASTLSPAPAATRETPARGSRGDEGEEDDLCGICREPAERPVSSACGHSFCRTCVQELIETAPGDVECPSCSEPLTVDLSAGSP